MEFCEGMSAATPLNSTTKAPTHHQIKGTTSRLLCMFIYAIKLIIYVYKSSTYCERNSAAAPPHFRSSTTPHHTTATPPPHHEMICNNTNR